MAHYVSNASLLPIMIDWLDRRAIAIQENTPLPRLPEEIGAAALQIATRLSRKPNFNWYSFKDDMIADAMICVCSYCHNFQPHKSTNVFAYLTQVVHNSFIRRLGVEKKHTYVKAKYNAHLNEGQPYSLHPHDDRPSRYKNPYANTLVEHGAETATDIIKDFEHKLANKKKYPPKATRTPKERKKRVQSHKLPVYFGVTKECYTCRLTLDHGLFHKSALSKDGRANHCKACKKAHRDAKTAINIADVPQTQDLHPMPEGSTVNQLPQAQTEPRWTPTALQAMSTALDA